MKNVAEKDDDQTGWEILSQPIAVGIPVSMDFEPITGSNGVAGDINATLKLNTRDLQDR